MRIIPCKFDANSETVRSNILVGRVKPTGVGRYSKARCLPEKPKKSKAKTYEGLALIEYLLDSGKPHEAQKVFNKLKRQMEQGK
jgi:hypothetical protein